MTLNPCKTSDNSKKSYWTLVLTGEHKPRVVNRKQRTGQSEQRLPKAYTGSKYLPSLEECWSFPRVFLVSKTISATIATADWKGNCRSHWKQSDVVTGRRTDHAVDAAAFHATLSLPRNLTYVPSIEGSYHMAPLHPASFMSRSHFWACPINYYTVQYFLIVDTSHHWISKISLRNYHLSFLFVSHSLLFSRYKHVSQWFCEYYLKGGVCVVHTYESSHRGIEIVYKILAVVFS